MTIQSPLTHTGSMIAELLSEISHLREIEAANKETILYWRAQYALQDAQINKYKDAYKAAIKRESFLISKYGRLCEKNAMYNSIEEWVQEQE